ncbi:MAG: DegT/DnrJ/EryC1/StrS family aminotransferase, partial [Planctomycetota bacterium]
MPNIHPLAHNNLKSKPPKDHGSFIPYGRQWIDEEDIQAVTDVLRSDYLTQGSRVEAFEKAFADYVGSRYAVAVNNGTAGLQLACLPSGLGTGDEVITSPITFVASANCALHVGSKPGFADIYPKTCNLDPLKLESYLEEKASVSESGRRPAANKPRAVIPVHFAGLPCDMPEIYRVAEKFNLVIIEDACHALGAEYRVPQSAAGGQRNGEDEWIKVGSCAHSHMAVFSFHPVKHITTGEGGMVTTNDKNLYDRLLLLRSHGITRDSGQFINLKGPKNNSGKAPPWYYEMKDLGYNCRITDIQCALGLSQLKKADLFIDVRRHIAVRYQEELSIFSAVQLTQEPGHCRSSYHLFTIKIDF